MLTGSTNLVSSPKRYNPNFHIFLQWSRNNCGLEFLDAIESGDVQFDVMDQYDGKFISIKNFTNQSRHWGQTSPFDFQNSFKNHFTSISSDSGTGTENPRSLGI